MKKENHSIIMYNKIKCFFYLSMTFFSCFYANAAPNDADIEMFNQFITAQGISQTITFDASNIKQFWIDNSVISKGKDIMISLDGNNPQKQQSSIPLKIQLDNVCETQNCRIDVFTEDPNISFVIENKSKTIGKSQPLDDFILLHDLSSTIHLEDTNDFSFNIRFISKDNKSSVSIYKIVLSFSENKESSYLGSPGYNLLLKEFNKNGIETSNPQILYLVSEKHNKLFLKIPDDEGFDNPFFYHIFPVNSSDLEPGRTVFNNKDFTLKKEKIIIPKPYSSKSVYTILQCQLPTYRFSRLRLGQFRRSDGKQLWSLELNESKSEQE